MKKCIMYVKVIFVNILTNEFSLQEWVTATAIRISLTRMNTFGDEVFGDARVLKSYFFAISDLSVGARYFTTR